MERPFSFAGPPQAAHFWYIACMRQATPFYTRLAMVLVSLIALFYIAVLGKSILAPLVFGLLFAVFFAFFAWQSQRVDSPTAYFRAILAPREDDLNFFILLTFPRMR